MLKWSLVTAALVPEFFLTFESLRKWRYGFGEINGALKNKTVNILIFNLP